jgi:hypothetical protein
MLLDGQWSIKNFHGESKEWNSMWSSQRYGAHHRMLLKLHAKWSALNLSTRRQIKMLAPTSNMA